MSPRGGLVLCEDGDRVPQKLQILTRAGQLTEFAAMNVQLNGERNDLKGDFRDSEWAGATFSPTGKWLFCEQSGARYHVRHLRRLADAWDLAR